MTGIEKHKEIKSTGKNKSNTKFIFLYKYHKVSTS